MIFTTMKERDRVFGIIEKGEEFDDLTPVQSAFIKGMYAARECLFPDMEKTDVELLDALIDEIAKNTSEEIEHSINVSIAHYYVGFSDENMGAES